MARMRRKMHGQRTFSTSWRAFVARESPDQGAQDKVELQALDARINALLPPQYQGCYEDVRPTSMGSAGLKFDPDGRVAWDEIWTSFCDLALAGGPPHRGSFLEPASTEEAQAAPEQYQKVVEEIGRGIWLVTGLPVLPRFALGWVGVRCASTAMAAWLVRAIVAENVSARSEHSMLLLPAGPSFRLEKEIKNVVTALAKTCHHWSFHMTAEQQAAAALTFDDLSSASALIGPALPAEACAAADDYGAVVAYIEQGIRRTTGLTPTADRYLGWVGVPCHDEETAAWLLRAVIVENVLVRREGSMLYLPLSPAFAAAGQTQRIVEVFAGACRLWGIYQGRPAGPCS
jgi:hypothetical protein